MALRFGRRVIGTWLAAGMIVMALSACARGPMTMAEMVCCAEHHDECDMAREAESCCAPDRPSALGILVSERSATTHGADAVGPLVILPQHRLDHLAGLAVIRLSGHASLLDRVSRSAVTGTVLRI